MPSVGNFLIGIAVSLVASLISTVGVNIQALSLKEKVGDYSRIEQSSAWERLWFTYKWHIGMPLLKRAN